MTKRKTSQTIDANDAQMLCYNDASGAFKQSPAGPKLKYIALSNVQTFVGAGKQIAIWAAAAGSTISMGDKSITSLALGAGGIPLAAGWNYLAMGEDAYVIGSSATSYLFEIVDDTFI